MIYNNGHKFLHAADPMSQDEIWNCPEFFAMSYAEIFDHPTCTDALKRALNEFPFSGRKNVIQVRPQDWRYGRPDVLGDGWHIDVNVRLADGIERSAKSMDDWRLMLCSWGDVTETNFMSTQLDLPDATPPHDYGRLFENVNSIRGIEYRTPLPNQIVEYTNRDIHRVGLLARLGKLRLMIVVIESDDITASGMAFPSMANNGNSKGFIK